ncbi:DUF4429 domain-containing protein [Nocardiopsis alborubida]|uniref:DUF4429 domain-containing protein n=1 Tax=Nocardiopsis alborubida TaxID=146802 RepID=A0A7X6RPN9_9ACTN|nr:DUF4429 domain-containing protein [Nocardiopsis alborubida]NKY97387.1 DUF4429 domain-containing protein [Nocardiopsis alborubida]
MDDLRGDQAVWRFDGETVAIRYEAQGWFKDPLLKRIGQIELPVAAIAEVDFQPGAGRRKGWVLQLRLHERTDPYAAVGAMLKEKSQPFRLTGQASGELVAEYLADQIRFAAGQSGPPAPDTAALLVPRLPFHIQTSEGTATLDGSTVRLVWSGGEAGGRKRRAQRREYDLSEITGVDWAPSDGWEWGYMRLVTADAGKDAGKPKQDLHALVADEGAQGYDTLLMAAAITAHVWAAAAPGPGGPEGRGVAARLRDPRWWLDAAVRSTDQLRGLTAGPAAPDTGTDAGTEDAGPGTRPATGTEAGPRTGAAPGEAAGLPDTEWIFRQIERLGELHARGLLTDEEFSAKKAELLGRI